MAEEKEHPEKSKRPRRFRDGRDRQVHLEITARRFEGGPPPTPEAYARALEEWHKLPGAVVQPATDLRPAQRTPTAPDAPIPLPASEAHDKEGSS